MFFTYLLSLRWAGGTYHSFSTYNIKQSALIHMFESDKVAISNKDRNKLLKYMSSLRKSIASENRKKGIKTKVGKKPMSFSCCKLTFDLLVVEGTSKKIFFTVG